MCTNKDYFLLLFDKESVGRFISYGYRQTYCIMLSR